MNASIILERERLALVRRTVFLFMKLTVRAAVSLHQRPIVCRKREVSTDSVDHVSLHEDGQQRVLSVFMNISFLLTMGGYYCFGAYCIISRR